MSIEAQTVEYVYVGDGISTVFPFPSRFLASTDILVGLDGIQQTTGFSVGGAGSDSGGSVVFSVAPVIGTRVALLRKPLASQLVDFINGQTVLEDILDNALDKLTMICQYLLRTTTRSIRLSDLDATTALTPLPAAVDRANRFLGFDSNGDPLLAANLGDIAAVPFATQAQAIAGTNNDTIMTPLRVAQAVGPAVSSEVNSLLASQAEAESGVNNTKLMTPLRVAEAIAALGGGGGSNQFYDVVVNGGADNTGATNATVALETAFAAAATAKKIAWVPEGIYEIEGDSIDITAANLMVVMHKDAVIRKSLNTSFPAVNVVADGLRWIGGNINYTNLSTNVSGNHAGLWLQGTDNHVEKLKVKGRFYVGVYLNSCRDTVIRDCISKGAVNRSFYCAFQTSFGDANLTLENCKADGAEAEGGSTKYTNYGFNTNGFGTGVAYNIRFVNCIAQYQTFHGFGLSERITQCQVIGCRADDISGPGFLVQNANGYRGSRINFAGCASIRAQYGFMVLNSDYVSMSGCMAGLSSADGFFFSGCSNVALPGSISENTTGWGFISDAGTSRISFVGCIATSNGSGGYSIGGTGHATIGNL